MPLTPHAYLSWWAPPRYDGERKKWTQHAHVMPLGDGVDCFYALEDAASDFAESISHCAPDHHGGRGYTHTTDQVKTAFQNAVTQLIETDFEAEWRDIERKIRAHRLWGGQVPAAVLMPDEIDPRDWKILLTNAEGQASVYNVKQGVLADAIPLPVAGKNAVKGRYGWKTPPRLPAQERMERLLREQRRRA